MGKHTARDKGIKEKKKTLKARYKGQKTAKIKQEVL